MNVQEWLEAGKPWNVILYGDCMDLMKHFNDKEINLSIVDPPYGIGEDGDKIREYNSKSCEAWKGRKPKEYNKKDWDDERPSPEYFAELQRVSKNQIIWGGNYFADVLKPTGSWIDRSPFIAGSCKTTLSPAIRLLIHIPAPVRARSPVTSRSTISLLSRKTRTTTPHR